MAEIKKCLILNSH